MYTQINPFIILVLGIIVSVAAMGFGGYLIAGKKKNTGWISLGIGAIILIFVLIWYKTF